MPQLWRAAHPLVLASKSAARRALLEAARIPFEIDPASIDERAVEEPHRASGAPPEALARLLAREKAADVSRRHAGRLVVGSDQTLALGERLFNKAASRAEAAERLALLAGRTHHLHSAVALARDGRILFEACDSAALTMRPMSADAIAAYLDAAGDGILGSVGCYQLEALGEHLFDRVAGDHSTILGLPVAPLLRVLRDNGWLAF